MHSCAELTCARRPTRVEAWPILLWDVAQQATEHHGVAWVSKTTAQRVARVLAAVGIGRAATEVAGNWPANHAPLHCTPGTRPAVHHLLLARRALPSSLHRCLRPRAHNITC
jgi:hypothetical protein